MNDAVRIDRFGAVRAADLDTAVAAATHPDRHGRLPDWQAALDAVPDAPAGWRIDHGVLVAGEPADTLTEAATALKGLIPWRKGPLRLAGVSIDTEWRSDWKWDRVAPQVDLGGRHVLDIGGGNGYFAWRMLDAGAASVTVCDPTLVFWMQHRAIARLAGPAALDFLPLRFEALPAIGAFDVVFSMGVLYHRRDPLEHLARIARHLAPGGTLVLETLVLPGDGNEQLDPPGRYANMRNVHRLPTVPRLGDWLVEAGYAGVAVCDRTRTTTAEQRPTDWMPFHSLANALTPDRSATIEGHPPPLRAVLTARRPA
ncbi:tRNA 5-methoxyuridine(34)/uridine 5-oxyacetic acid(34) synthase CmoB [Wenzhouxiangella sp. XN79A]|uniref:tRNA 5-methoxyuridine(34)/uridine 5-oxyacetic acid(34) synthase CmoB n=1 Tax=Wenzhouxiangella sp. XN79A TaxID=2724193 RepID=UPI00144A5CEC|nr:tRNA 5-methoxyuridine(34)/uridine 5-oxyacetic acid(34) synthase CmoB [Wenzhouxiangella sp. XN79A]NKI33831.1 tRNA 5-methoxyuridine(34)/uridine 5-oxyacetic acid(34) synthase CmoB [Wenzhouxiangella sp. XN79A]